MKRLNFESCIFIALLTMLACFSSVSADTAITNAPYLINTPGTYYLNNSISFDGTAITITCNDVVINGNGYTISSTAMTPSGRGIYADGFSNITIKNVTIDHFESGIYLNNISDSLIENTTLHDNMAGILIWTVSDCTLTNNTAYQNGYGIQIKSSSNNTITNNNVTSCMRGIDLLYSSNNTITNNNAALNNDAGIYLDDSSNNDIYNNFFNNTNNVVIDASTNNWNASVENGGGNYWFLPNGTGHSETQNDTNGDGFCDDQYNITSVEIDFLPLLWDKTAPEVSINTPANGIYYNTSSVPINITANDSRSIISTVTAEIDGVRNVTLTLNGTYYTGNTGTLSDGNHIITIFANDTAGNMDSSANVTFTTDTTSPVITVNTENGAYFNNGSNILNFTVTEVNLDNITVLNVSTPIGIENSTGNYLNVLEFVDGFYNITITVNDTAGNTRNATVTFTVDTVNPEVTVNNPVNGTAFTTNSAAINLTANDSLSGVSTVTAEIGNVRNVTLTLNGNYYTGNTGTLSNGNYEITITATDLAGNVNSSETVNITIAVPASTSSGGSGGGSHYSSDLSDGITSSVIKNVVSNSNIVYGSEIDEGFALNLRENLQNGNNYELSGNTIIVGGPLANGFANRYDSEFGIQITNQYPGENRGVIQVKNIELRDGNIIKTYQVIYIAGSDRYGTEAALDYFKTLGDLLEGPLVVEWTKNGPVLVE